MHKKVILSAVMIIHPLKQGLKLFLNDTSTAGGLSHDYSSTKTRIETDAVAPKTTEDQLS